MSMAPSFLVLQAMGANKAGTLDSLSRTCVQAGCQILDSRWMVLGDTFTFCALLKGPWSAIAKLEGLIPRLEKKLHASISAKRTDWQPGNLKAMPYSIEIISGERPGIIQDVTSYLVNQKIGIIDLLTESYVAPRTAFPMIVLRATVSIPVDIGISTFRDEFIQHCEELQLDMAMEPYKH